MFSRIVTSCFLCLSSIFLVACMSSETPQVTRNLAFEQPKILTMGDSLLAGNAGTGTSIAQRLEVHLGEPIVDRSYVSASMGVGASAGTPIPSQYVTGNWDVIVLNGGGNDIYGNCLCAACNRTIDELISPDGRSGRIVSLVNMQLATQADVIYVGHLRNQNVLDAFAACGAEGFELERRIETLALATPRFHYLEVTDSVIPNAAPKVETPDNIYLSSLGTNEVARRIAALIRGIRVQRAGNDISAG